MYFSPEIFILGPLICLLVFSVFLTIKTGFIQFRALPLMFKMLIKPKVSAQTDSSKTISPYKALFTAMSTTIGIGNIVGPAIAIRLGGPGALLGFLVAVIFGAATTFTEVVFATEYRSKLPDGSFAGGPMQYLAAALGRWAGVIYAFFAAILLVAWSSNHSNTLADIFYQHGVSKYFSAAVVTALVVGYLIAGIRSIGNLASKIVPLKFLLYCSGCLWIIYCNVDQVLPALKLVFQSAFDPKALGGAAAGFSVYQMLRWGLAKGIQASEAGVGTTTLPYAQSSYNNAFEQGVLAMASTYSVAFICFLSGLVTLVTGSWADQAIPVGMSLIAKPFTEHFSYGVFALVIIMFLSAFGTILGNAYNGSRCFLFLTNNKYVWLYYCAIGASVFIGALFAVEAVWAVTDYFVIPVVLTNILGLLVLVLKKKRNLRIDS